MDDLESKLSGLRKLENAIFANIMVTLAEGHVEDVERQLKHARAERLSELSAMLVNEANRELQRQKSPTRGVSELNEKIDREGYSLSARITNQLQESDLPLLREIAERYRKSETNA